MCQGPFFSFAGTAGAAKSVTGAPRNGGGTLGRALGDEHVHSPIHLLSFQENGRPSLKMLKRLLDCFECVVRQTIDDLVKRFPVSPSRVERAPRQA